MNSLVARARESEGAQTALVLAVFLVSSACYADCARDAAGLPVVAKAISASEAVDIALANHPSVAARRAMAAAAAARTGMARAGTRPQLSTSTFAATGKMPMILAGPPGVTPQNITMVPEGPRIGQNLMAMLPLYTGGKLRGRLHGAQASESAALAEVTLAEVDAALAAKVAFLSALLSKEFVDAYQTRVDESRERLRIAEVAFTEGRIAKYDLLRNRTDLAEAEQMLVDAQRGWQTAMIDLKDVLGISQSSEIELRPEPISGELERDPEKLRALALGRRPEAVAARARTGLAQALLAVARSTCRPKIYATAMQDFATTRADRGENGFIVGVTAALPILDGGERKAAVAEAEAMLAQAQADEKKTALMVVRDVATQLAELDAAEKTDALAGSAVEQSKEDYRVVRMRYEAGKAINVEVLDALAASTRAKTAAAEASTNVAIARERLKWAVGSK